jgi:RecA/RadA recombinase
MFGVVLLIGGVGMDKKKALEMALTQIEKQFGKGSIMKLGESTHMNVEAIPTGALELDVALGVGGIPRGISFPNTFCIRCIP